MKKMTCFLNLLAVSSLLFAGVNPANAVPALKGFSPNDATIINPGGAVATVKGLPAWFQGQDGVAVKPCLDLAKCLAAGAPDFNPALPLSYPTNFPSEAFYFDATNANIPVGTANALVVMALEFTFVDALGNLVPASAPGAVGNPFQRLRLTHTFIGGGGVLANLVPPPPAGGSFTVTTPWGTAVFPVSTVKCVNQGGDTKCTVTRDQPVAGPNFIAALGDPVLAPGSISTFLQDPTVAAAFPGFLGNGGAAASFIGAPAGGLNQITVTDPFGVSGTTTLLSALIGQTVGLEITPPVGGNDFGVVKATPGSVRKTFTVNNLTGAVVGLVPVTVPVTPPAPLLFTPRLTNVVTSAVSTDFTIAAPLAITLPATKACALGAGATMAIGEICSFDVIFSPVTVDGPKTATIFISGANTPTAQLTVTGIADGTVPALAITGISSFTKSPTQTISGTVSDLNGIAGVSVSVDGAVVATPNATVNAATGTWSFAVPALAVQDPVTGLPVHAITVTATDNAQSTAVGTTPGNLATATSTIVVDNTLPSVAITAPAAGIFTNNNKPTLVFTATDRNLAVTTLKVDGTIVTAAAVSPATLGPLTDSTHNAAIEALDSAGNLTTDTKSFTVDTIAPVITITSPVITAAGTIGVSSPSMTFTINDVNPSQADLNPFVPGAPLPAAGTPGTLGRLDSLLVPADPPVLLHHPIVFSTDALGKVTGSITLVDPNSVNPDVVPSLNEGETRTVTIDTTDLAGNVSAQKKVTFTVLFKDGSMTTLGATPPTIADVILALKVALGGFPEAAGITPNTDKFKHGDVFPLDAAGKPIGDSKIDVGDVLTILKKVVGQITTF